MKVGGFLQPSFVHLSPNLGEPTIIMIKLEVANI